MIVCYLISYVVYKGNRIQCSVKKNIMHKYEGIIEEGKCYRISNFAVADNSGKFPLLGHMYKIVFYKNTILTRIKDFDENSMGFKFVSIGEIKSKQFKDNDVVGMYPLLFFTYFLNVIHI